MPFSMKRTIEWTLQVQIRTRKYFHSVIYPRFPHVKKAFLSASLTLEAALVLPLFLFAAVLLMLPMKILSTDRKIQAGLEAAGEDLSRLAYLQNALERGDVEALKGAGEMVEGARGLIGAAALIYVQNRIGDYIDTEQVRGFHLWGSNMDEEENRIALVAEYEIVLPFPTFGLGSIKRTAKSVRRRWIGKSREDDAADQTEEEIDNRIVYVGRNGKRYHLSRSCHYLANTLTAVSVESAKERKNSKGERYHACSSCGSAVKAGDTVYIMPSGTSYHADRGCRSIMAYVRAVRFSEVKHLGACSYCSTEGGD